MAQIEKKPTANARSLTSRTHLRVDLTPMVDLGFLLITFFILSTTFLEPNVANLVMPKDSKIETKIHESAVLTLMPNRNNEVDYFEGSRPDILMHCSYAQVRSVIQQKQKKVAEVLGNRNKMVIIIQPGDESSYKNFIDILDEIQINDVQHYFITKQQSSNEIDIFF